MSDQAPLMSFDSALRNRITNHFTDNVLATPLETEPFPHIIIRNFLPDDIYDLMLKNIPDYGLFEPFGYEKHQQDGSSNRKRFELKNATIEKLGPKMQRMWLTFRSALGSPELKNAVFQVLSPGLAFRYGCSNSDVGRLPGFALPELFHETAGYQIAPHPDTRKKVVTMQIALPGDDSLSHLGTEFYSRSLSPLSWLRAPRGFDTVKRMPFDRNTAYAFVVLNTLTLKSWHGRTKLEQGSVVRNSILNIWYEKAEHGNPDLIREQLAEDQLRVPLKRVA